jgi:hypothetical protein
VLAIPCTCGFGPTGTDLVEEVVEEVVENPQGQ